MSGVWREREYGQLKGTQVERSLAGYRELWGLSGRVLEKVGENPKVFEDQGIEVPFPWAELYQRPFAESLAVLAVQCGMADEIKTLAKTDNPTSAFFERFIDDDSTPDDAHPGLVYTLCVIGNANLRAISLYSRTMSELVAEFDHPTRGDIALAKALWIDPTVLGLPSAMSLFVAAKNKPNQYIYNSFLRSLRNGPDRRKIDKMELRWVEYLLRDIGAFEQCSKEDIFDLVVNGLGLYRHDGDKGDAFKALVELFRTWRKPDSK